MTPDASRPEAPTPAPTWFVFDTQQSLQAAFVTGWLLDAHLTCMQAQRAQGGYYPWQSWRWN